jgi:uncharacterized membrane protein
MRRGNRFGGGLLSAPLWVRAVVTVALGIWGLLLVRELMGAADEPDPRWAAMVFFYLGLWALFTVVVLRGVWRSRVEWSQARQRERHDAWRLSDRLSGPRTRSDLGGSPDDAGRAS